MDTLKDRKTEEKLYTTLLKAYELFTLSFAITGTNTEILMQFIIKKVYYINSGKLSQKALALLAVQRATLRPLKCYWKHLIDQKNIY